jgi:hypothetical protein
MTKMRGLNSLKMFLKEKGQILWGNGEKRSLILLKLWFPCTINHKNSSMYFWKKNHCFKQKPMHLCLEKKKTVFTHMLVVCFLVCSTFLLYLKCSFWDHFPSSQSANLGSSFSKGLWEVKTQLLCVRHCLALSFFFVFIYLGVLGFELRASHLVVRHCTAWATLPAFFAPVILEIKSCFLHRWAWTEILLFLASHCHWDDGWVPPCTIFFCSDRVLQIFFLPRLAWNHDPPNLSLPYSLGWQVYPTMSN